MEKTIKDYNLQREIKELENDLLRIRNENAQLEEENKELRQDKNFAYRYIDLLTAKKGGHLKIV